MRARLLAWALAATLGCVPAWGAEKVGRTSFDLPEGWTLVTAYQARLSFNGGARTMPLHHALYQLPGPADTPRALLLVSSTEGGYPGNVDWISESCPVPRLKYFVHDFGGGALTRKRECLVVNAEFAPLKDFKADAEPVIAMESKGLKFFRSGYSLRSVMGVRGGTLLRVNLMTQRDFAGLPEGPVSIANLHGVARPLVAWGEALHQAVGQSAYSIGGSLQLPPLSFTP